MRGVGGISRSGAAATGKHAGTRTAGSGFSVGGTGTGGAAAETASTSGTAAVVGLSLLAAQENGGRAGRDEAARRRATCILDELRGLQAELLGGRPDSARLARIAALQAGEDGADPGLREAVRAVALRARVELARRGRDGEANRSAAVP